MNEKVFLILWFWLAFLISASVLRLAWTAASSTVLLPLARRRFVAGTCKRTRADILDMDELPNIRSLIGKKVGKEDFKAIEYVNRPLYAQGGGDGLTGGLVFVLKVISVNSRPDVFKETVLQTLAAIKEGDPCGRCGGRKRK